MASPSQLVIVCEAGRKRIYDSAYSKAEAEDVKLSCVLRYGPKSNPMVFNAKAFREREETNGGKVDAA